MTRGTEEIRLGSLIMPSWKHGFGFGVFFVAFGVVLAALVFLAYGMAGVAVVIPAGGSIVFGSWAMLYCYDRRYPGSELG